MNKCEISPPEIHAYFTQECFFSSYILFHTFFFYVKRFLRPSCTVFVKFFEAPYGSNNKNIYTEYIWHKIMCFHVSIRSSIRSSRKGLHMTPCCLKWSYLFKWSNDGPFFCFSHTLSYLLITDMVWYLTVYRLHTWCHFPFVWTHSSPNVIFAAILWQHRVKPWYQCFPFFLAVLSSVFTAIFKHLP